MPPKDIAAFSLCSVIAAVLVFFLLGPFGLFVAPLLNIAAITMGAIALNKLKAIRQSTTLAVVSLSLGIIGLILDIILFILTVVLTIAAGHFIFSTVLPEVL